MSCLAYAAPKYQFREQTMRLVLPIMITCIVFGAATVHATSAFFYGPDLVVRSGKTTFRLSDIADEHAFFTIVHAAARKGRDFYLLIGSSELTRGWPPKSGYCGCGIESFIRWLHVRDGKVVDTQEGLYASCRANRDGWTIGWENGKLIWCASGWKRSENISKTDTAIFLNWSFDPQHPDKGITEEVMLDTWQSTKK